MLHIERSTTPKINSTSSQYDDQILFNRNIVHCLYNLLQKFQHHKTLTPEIVHEQLQLVFDINVINDQFEKLSESLLGQCVQQVHIETEANTLRSVTCKYIYGSRVAANQVKPGTSVPTVGYHTLSNSIEMHDALQIQSKVSKKLISYLQGVYGELLKAGDISSIKGTNVSKQNTLANYYEHLEYQNELKNRSMHAGLCYRLVEEMWDRAPPIYSLPPCIKDYSGQSPSSLLSWLLGATNKYTFALNKHNNQAKEASILAEFANIWRINTDNSLSPSGCETNFEIIGENKAVSGVVLMTDNTKVKLQNHIIARNTKLTNKIKVCDVHPEDFNPQRAFITDGKIRMESTNMFVKDEKKAEADTTVKKVEYLKMGTDIFAIHIVDPAYYRNGDTTAKDRFKEMVSVDFMMPLACKFKGHATDDMFRRDNGNANVLPTEVYFKDAKGVTKCISVKQMIPFITGILQDMNCFKDSFNAAAERLTKLFKISLCSQGKEKDVILEQKVRAINHINETFPLHYVLTNQHQQCTPRNVDKILDNVMQKPLWIMISGLTYEALVTNIVALWNEHGFTDAVFDVDKLGRHSLSFARRKNISSKSRHLIKHAGILITHAISHVKRFNNSLLPWIDNHGKQLKNLLIDKMGYPAKIAHYVEFVIYMLNSEQMYKQIFTNGTYHLGVSFVLNRKEIFDTESMLLSRCQGYKLFYSETTTEVRNDCQSSDYNLVTSMQTGHMPSSLSHPCIRFPHCILTEYGTIGTEVINSDFFFDKKKPVPNYDENVWIPILSSCEMSESMFEDSFNPYGRSNVAFDEKTLDYLNPDHVIDPLSGIAGYNPLSLGMLNINFVFHSRLFVTPAGFMMKKHVLPNRHTNYWFNEFQKNAARCKNRLTMTNLEDNKVSNGEFSLHFDDLSQVLGGSVCKFCFSHPKMVKTIMTDRDNRRIPGRNVYRQNNDYLMPGNALMENLDRGINCNDRYLLNM